MWRRSRERNEREWKFRKDGKTTLNVYPFRSSSLGICSLSPDIQQRSKDNVCVCMCVCKRERERRERGWKKRKPVEGRGAWKPTVPHERLKVKLRSTTAQEFGFPLVTEYSQSYPTLPAASAALTLKYDLILPLRTSNRRGKRFRDVPLPSGRPYGCLP